MDRSQLQAAPARPRVKPPANSQVLPAGHTAGTVPIVFTGQRHDDLYAVIVKGKCVMLPRASLKALLEMVLARAAAGTGFIRLNPVTVCRLRGTLDKVVGAGAGRDLIETGSTKEYRLAIADDQLPDKIAVMPSFFELVDLQVIPPKQAQSVRRLRGLAK